MMDAVSLVMSLANVVPAVLQWLGHENAAGNAAQILSTVRDITGEKHDEAAIKMLRNNPTMVQALTAALYRHQEALMEMETRATISRENNAAAVNQTMQVESSALHWPTYSWRPFIGFCFGATAICSSLTVAMCYLGVMFFQADSQILSVLPGMIGAEAGIMATMSPVLGIASWFRGKMQINQEMAGHR
ncbi:hypothetical protein [Pantoea phytobeneficialis]|uniref:Uncharacterized protein n=2 Tax=Pantoea phytobeneficialis TaxID=2052056 RepID=A0ABT8XVD6_9GAMM|nr:hypothetical protein [Pantoea phytobeneficialis]MDO6407422.1 hypothetical protein [Pantoea phytobeneficialis]